MYHPSHRLVLASASPRRHELLTRAGYVFDVMPADIEERRLEGEAPRAFVARVAVEKATAVAARAAETAAGSTDPARAASSDRPVVIGADTVVVLDGEVFGKPPDAAGAARMLRRLSGRSHEVLTGVALLRGTTRRTAVAATTVTLVTLDEPVIEWYVLTGEPMDKAGAYGAQGIGSRFVDRVDGSYTNVVGLPIAVFDRLLTEV